MNYLEMLKNSATKYKSLVCLGLDPDLSQIPIEGEPEYVITTFYENILNKIIQHNVFPSAVKPNYAFYAQYGFAGLKALKHIIDIFKKENIPVILDSKRGDIGNTAKAYAKESFDFFEADAVTLSPYMGYDSISPFIEEYPDKGYYILTKTSNKSSSELQDILIDDKSLFLYAAELLIKWYHPGIGSVVGATFTEQLKHISTIYINSNYDIPLLIPGIGSQGGDLEGVMNILKTFQNISIHRINSSRGINYAYKNYDGLHYADAAVEELKKLNDAINSHINSPE